MLKSASLKNDRKLLLIQKQLTLGCKNVSLITKGIMAGSDPQPKKATPPRPAIIPLVISETFLQSRVSCFLIIRRFLSFFKLVDLRI